MNSIRQVESGTAAASEKGSSDAYDRLIETRIAEAMRHLDPPQPPQTHDVVVPDVDIVIPVHDAFDAFRVCIDSVLLNTAPRHRLILIDDASSDARVRVAMRELAARHVHIVLRLQDRNLGYLHSVNAAIAQSRRDVVLLNSDTVLGPQWLERLARAACAEPGIGIACPLSDNATLLTILDSAGLDASAAQQLAAATARGVHPRLPTAVGFCMYVRRAVFDAIGAFDAAFDPGYGEENDFSMRAWRAGFDIVACTDVIVLHRSGASFGQRDEVRRRRFVHERLLAARWPQYEALVRAWWRDWPMREQGARIEARRIGTSRPRALHLSHRVGRLGGVELHTRGLVQALAAHLDNTLMAPERMPHVWADLLAGPRDIGWDIKLANQHYHVANQRIFGVAADLSDPGVERQFLHQLVGGGYRLLHIHSLLHWNSLVLPLLAARSGVRVVVTLHNLESLCPDYTLVPPDRVGSCGKTRAGIDADCTTCLTPRRFVRSGAQVPEFGLYLQARHHFWRRVLHAADAVIAPSTFVRERIARAFGPEAIARTVVIPHGIADSGIATRKTNSDTVLRVGYLGGEARAKGVELVLDVAAALLDAPIEFHIYAIHDETRLGREIPSNVVLRGRYLPDQRAQIFATLDVVLIPSLGEETFSLLLSECQAGAVPVIASDVGALRERLADARGGWLLPAHDTAAWRELLLHLSTPQGRLRLREMSAWLAAQPVRGLQRNAQDYWQLYQTALADTTHKPPAPLPTRVGLDIASTRLREAMRELPAPSSCDWLPEDGDVEAEQSACSLHALVLVEAHNAALVERSLRSLREAGCAATLVVLPGSDDSWPAVDASSDIATIRFDAAETLAKINARCDEVGAQWHIAIEAGDRLHRRCLAWLARLAADCAFYADYDFIDGTDRHYAPVTQPAWDPVLLLGCNYAVHGLFIGAAALRAIGGWQGTPLGMRYATCLALGDAGKVAGAIGAVLCHRGDINVSPAQRDVVRRACTDAVTQSLQHGGGSWIVDADGALPGWSVSPRLAHVPEILILVWGTPENPASAQAVAALREAIDRPRVRVAAYAPGMNAADCDFVVLWRSGLSCADRDWPAKLAAWASQPEVAMVAPLRVNLAGAPLAAGLDYDGAALRWRASPAAGGLAEHGMRSHTCAQAALSTACLMLARNAATAATLRALAQPDCLETFATQFEVWRWGKRAVWTPDVAVRQPFSEASLQAAAADGRERLLDNLLTTALPDAHRYALESRFGRAQRTLSKRRPRVVALTRDDWAASQYRVHQPLADLHGAGLIETPQVARVRQMRVPGVLDVAALDADAVVFHHCFDDASLQLLDDLAKRASCARVIVVDDLLTAVPEYNPMRANVFADIEQRLQRALAACTCLVVTSAGLAQAYGGLAKRVVVIENALPQAPWSSLARKLPHAAPARRLRVGWAGAQQHSGDLELLDHLLRTFTSVQWVFLGMAPAAARDTDAEIHAMVPFAEYPARLAQLDLDLALAPLLDNPFNRCKSALKLIEFGALGIPVVASDVAPYQNAPVHRVDNTPQAWSSALDALLRDAALRAECALTLQQWAWSRHRLIDRRAAWLDALGLAGTA